MFHVILWKERVQLLGYEKVFFHRNEEETKAVNQSNGFGDIV